MADEEGASPKERLFEACRRENLELLEEVLEEVRGDSPEDDDEPISRFLDTTTDPRGNTALHVAAKYGSFQVIDEILDVEGVEVDPRDTIDKETPLHKAVQYAAEKDRHLGLNIVELLIDAGADPRIRNKHNQRPIDLANPKHEDLIDCLTKAEYSFVVGKDDIVIGDDEEERDGPGSASDED